MKRLIASLAITAVTIATSQAETFQFASPMNTANIYHKQVQEWADKVKEKTGGSVEFELVPNGALVSIPETLDALSDGVVPSGMVIASFISGIIPSMAYTSLMGSFPIKNPTAGEAMAKVWGDVDTLLAEHGTKALWGVTSFDSGVICRDGFLRTLEDWKGKKVRTTDRRLSNWVTAMGAIPLPLPTSDIYIALQNGVVECAMMVPSITLAARLYEVAPYYTATEFAGNMVMTVMNRDAWNDFSAEERSVITQVSQEMLLTSAENVQNASAKDLEELAKVGQVYKLTHEEVAIWRNHVAPVFDSIAETVSSETGKRFIKSLASFQK